MLVPYLKSPPQSGAHRLVNKDRNPGSVTANRSITHIRNTPHQGRNEMTRKVQIVVASLATLFALGAVAAPAEAKQSSSPIIFCC